ncbi:MAG TPA: hypothetical protein VMG34_14485 [Bacteroidota bacterium]|nr:hypothetical protein [Bacteroidota bacterium]
MNSVDERLNDLSEIRSLMEHSTKFLSLSGLSGVSAGTVGIAAYFIARQEMAHPWERTLAEYSLQAVVTLILALGLAVYFSTKMALKKKIPIWTPAAKHLVISLSVPLAAGGGFCYALVLHDLYWFIAPSMLLFYGLALLNSSKYTLKEIRALGYCQLLLGLCGSYWPDFGLLLWGVGFGLLHIVYGAAMYLKYEK